MRIAYAVALAALCGVALNTRGGADDKQTPRPPGENEATEEDAKAITAAIEHFSGQKLIWALGNRESKKAILVHKESSGPSPIYLSDTQLQSDLREEKWEVPAEASESLRQRNIKAAPLGGLKFGKAVIVADIEKVPPEFNAREYSEAKAYAHVWLPGYSKDGSTAVVRLSFGPTPHGATATYLLTKTDSAWKVTKWAFAYYL